MADILLATFLQLRRNSREHLNSDIVPGRAREALVKHMLYPLFVRLRERCMPPVEQVEFDGIAVALPSLDERVIRLADGVEWVESPRVEVGDKAEDGGDIVAEDGGSKVSTVN